LGVGKRGPKKGSVYAKTEAKRRGRARAIKLAEVTAERTMLELARIAFADRRRVWNANGTLKPLNQWTADEAACLEGLEVIKKNAEAGDGHIDVVHKVKLATKRDALNLLAKHFGLVTDKVDVTHHLSLEDLVAASNLPDGLSG
jgi:hypothetical protein